MRNFRLNIRKLISSEDGDVYETVTKKERSRTASNFIRFIEFISSRSIRQILAIFYGFDSKRLYRSSGKEKDSRCLVTMFSKLRGIMHVHVVVAQWRQRNVQKRVMHVRLVLILPIKTFCFNLISGTPFAASDSRGTKPPRWRAKVAPGQDKQKTYIIWNGNFLCLSCPSATFALQHGSFVPREWLAAKALF